MITGKQTRFMITELLCEPSNYNTINDISMNKPCLKSDCHAIESELNIKGLFHNLFQVDWHDQLCISMLYIFILFIYLTTKDTEVTNTLKIQRHGHNQYKTKSKN